MPNRSSALEIHYSPIPLDPLLPLVLQEHYIQEDRPITFLHVHDCLELGLCHQGEGIFMVGEKILPFSTGDVVFINSTEVHLAQSAPGSKSRWTWVYLDPILLVDHPAARAVLDPTPLAGPRFINILPAGKHPELFDGLRRIIAEKKQAGPHHRQALQALVWEWMVRIQRLAPKRSARAAVSRWHFDRLAPALQLLAQNYSLDQPIGELARACGLSEPHFRRLFRASIGTTPLAYRHDLRLRMATSLLRNTSRSILEISQDVGFESLSSFNRQFRQIYHTHPSAWRRGGKPNGESARDQDAGGFRRRRKVRVKSPPAKRV
ncbi:MAG: AraC family transcriptional regulator [Candidatus Methylacidiphilales bacterium]|nr:AraC family transcriptional regulator [Candidatus Methylacidiphilales bacterium]